MTQANSNKLKISLKDALDCLKNAGLLLFDIEIEEDSELALVWDSRNLNSDSLFIAIKGTNIDSHEFINEILNEPGTCVITEKVDDTLIEEKKSRTIPVKNSRLALSKLLALAYNYPDQDMVVIGITGTNGKSSTAFILESILSESSNTGLISTVFNRHTGETGESLTEKSTHTTEDPESLMKLFSKMQNSGVQKVVMEVSSHALDQYRVDGITFSGGVFTNLSQDHLDYHQNMENYYLSKRRFFLELLSLNKPMVICLESKWGRELKGDLHSFHRVFSFKRDETFTVLESSLNGIKGAFHWRGKGMEIESTLFGEFNIENLCSATIMAIEMGIPGRDIEAGIRKLKSIPGRMEKVENKKGFHILVDYAHTPDSLEKVLKTLKPLTKGKLITVFGCGGGRDQSKRAPMGKVASSLADIVILTSDNPRLENPQAIIDEILNGIPEEFSKNKDCLKVEVDRKKALKLALDLAAKGDTVLIAGKGHENTQILPDSKNLNKTVTVEFNDSESLKELLKY